MDVITGGGYDGVNSKKLLDAVDTLANALDVSCAPIIDSLRSVREVVSGFEKNWGKNFHDTFN